MKLSAALYTRLSVVSSVVYSICSSCSVSSLLAVDNLSEVSTVVTGTVLETALLQLMFSTAVVVVPKAQCSESFLNSATNMHLAHILTQVFVTNGRFVALCDAVDWRQITYNIIQLRVRDCRKGVNVPLLGSPTKSSPQTHL